jgi:uncharacterized membrane protein
MDIIDRIGPVRAWLGTLAAGILVFGGGSLVATQTVWDRFVWRYFWGPVYADAHNAQCAIKDGGSLSLGGAGFELSCATAAESAIVVTPGYTAVSEVGYMIVGLFFLIGIYLLLDRLNLGQDREMFFALVPFLLFGGVLRVIEDANDFVFAQTGDMVISYPTNTLLISPVIYFTVAGLTFAALIGSVSLSRRDIVDSYSRTLGAVGTLLLVVTAAALIILATTNDDVGIYPLFLLATVGLASGLAYGIYAAVDRFAPEVNAGTGYIGLVVLWAHAIDGVANVLASDWTDALGVPFAYTPKHPANAVIINVTESVQPASLTAAIGTSWPFLVVKLAVALGIVWLFSEEFMDESPRYSLILLVAIAAVGLGPGTRDMVRATFGI